MGKRIDNDIIDDAASTNSHGAGVAWFDPEKKKIVWLKGLDKEEVKTVLDKYVKNMVHAIHFRISTCGGVNDELTHPFSVDERASVETSGEADSVLFHNGVVHNWKEMLFQAYLTSGLKVPEPPFSDTRAMAVLCHVYGRNVLSLVEAAGSRFLIMDAKTDAKERMFRWGSWHQYKEFSFSNQGTRAFREPAVVDRRYSPGYRTTSSGPITNIATPPTATSSKDRRYKPAAGFSVWKRLKEDGLSLVADNENLTIETVDKVIREHTA